jgi:hypothetical protein
MTQAQWRVGSTAARRPNFSIFLALTWAWHIRTPPILKKAVGAKWVQNQGYYREKMAGARAKGSRISET